MRLSISIFALLLLCIATGCQEPEPPVSNVANDGPPEIERVVAEAGVGKQGQVIGEKEGFLRTPAKALFSAKQKIAFMSVEHAVNLYEGLEGHKPKTHEEFMEKVVKFNNIQLPELPEGHIYVWDPDKGQLMVERPKAEEEAN